MNSLDMAIEKIKNTKYFNEKILSILVFLQRNIHHRIKIIVNKENYHIVNLEGILKSFKIDKSKLIIRVSSNEVIIFLTNIDDFKNSTIIFNKRHEIFLVCL